MIFIANAVNPMRHCPSPARPSSQELMEDMASCKFEGDGGHAKLVDALSTRLGIEVAQHNGEPELLGALSARALMDLGFVDKGC